MMPANVVTTTTITTVVTKITKAPKAAKVVKAAKAPKEKMSALKLQQKAAGYMLAASNASKKK